MFTNLPNASVTTVISSSYTQVFTPGGCAAKPRGSEEHKPVVATIKY